MDFLVNCAGVMLPAPIAEADPADWRRMVEVNLTGVLHTIRAALPGMLERGDGHIVNVSSTSARAHQERFSVYAATNHGPGAFTEVLRKEVHPRRVRVTLFARISKHRWGLWQVPATLPWSTGRTKSLAKNR